jgi:signal peptidase I
MAGYRRRGVGWIVAIIVVTAASDLLLLAPRFALLAELLIGLRLVAHALSVLDGFLAGRRPRRKAMKNNASRGYLIGLELAIVGAGMWLAVWRAEIVCLRLAGVRYVKITTQAMRPTLQPGDTVLTHRVANLERWDVVIFRPPGRPEVFTQRIAGLPGEKIELAGGQLLINDRPVAPPAGVGPYASHLGFGPQTGCEGRPITLGPAEYFVLCDNPAVTYDSRSFPSAAPGHQVGAIPAEFILGRVTAVYWPIRRIRRIE